MRKRALLTVAPYFRTVSFTMHSVIGYMSGLYITVPDRHGLTAAACEYTVMPCLCLLKPGASSCCLFIESKFIARIFFLFRLPALICLLDISDKDIE